MNRAQHKEGGAQSNENVGPLELEAVSTLHELAPFVDTIFVSEILPKTAELIFINIKTKDGMYIAFFNITWDFKSNFLNRK